MHPDIPTGRSAVKKKGGRVVEKLIGMLFGALVVAVGLPFAFVVIAEALLEYYEKNQWYDTLITTFGVTCVVVFIAFVMYFSSVVGASGRRSRSRR